MNEQTAVAILIGILNYCKDTRVLEGTDFETISLDDISETIVDSIGLLDDFKTWFSMDPITKLRGKNRLSHLEAYYKNLHNEE